MWLGLGPLKAPAPYNRKATFRLPTGRRFHNKAGLFPYGRPNLSPYLSAPPTVQPFGLTLPPPEQGTRKRVHYWAFFYLYNQDKMVLCCMYSGLSRERNMP
jgi:hypothetical protein